MVFILFATEIIIKIDEFETKNTPNYITRPNRKQA
jgi:hypothetical protein